MSRTGRRLALVAASVAVAAAGVGLGWPGPLRGYTDAVAYDAGAPVAVRLAGPRGTRTVRLRDAAGRVVDSVRTTVRRQRTAAEPWARGFGWAETFRRAAPRAAGLYCWDGDACFVVRDPAQAVQVVYPSNTVAAYSQAGGKSLYVAARGWRVREALRRAVTFRWRDALPDGVGERARTVSFRRPVGQTHAAFQTPFFAWLARERVPAGVLADADLERGVPASTRLLVVVGHSEYWSRPMRDAFDAFVARGGHALVLSGNTAWWQARLDPAAGTLTVYREWDADPVVDPALKTVEWDDPRLARPILPSFGLTFPLGGYGGQPDAGWDAFRLLPAFARSPLAAGVALRTDSLLRLPTREFDGPPTRGTDGRGHPVADTAGFHRYALLGYDRGSRFGRPTVAGFVAFQRTAASGVVVHAGSTDWAGARGFDGADSAAVRRITQNALRGLLAGGDVFPRGR